MENGCWYSTTPLWHGCFQQTSCKASYKGFRKETQCMEYWMAPRSKLYWDEAANSQSWAAHLAAVPSRWKSRKLQHKILQGSLWRSWIVWSRWWLINCWFNFYLVDCWHLFVSLLHAPSPHWSLCKASSRVVLSAIHPRAMNYPWLQWSVYCCARSVHCCTILGRRLFNTWSIVAQGSVDRWATLPIVAQCSVDGPPCLAHCCTMFVESLHRTQSIPAFYSVDHCSILGWLLCNACGSLCNIQLSVVQYWECRYKKFDNCCAILCPLLRNTRSIAAKELSRSLRNIHCCVIISRNTQSIFRNTQSIVTKCWVNGYSVDHCEYSLLRNNQ